MGRIHWAAFAGALALAGCMSAPKPPVVAEVAEPVPTAPTVEVVFDEAAPGVVAPRLAAECTRLRMAVLENTPERVVCKHLAPGATELVSQPQAELWSFLLTATDGMGTRVEARRSFDGVSAGGYAVLSFAEVDDETLAAMRSFVETVRSRGGLRGTLAP